MYEFNAVSATDDIISWIRNYFEQNGKTSKAVIGISGGKDSTVVAALCVKALGKERTYGVLMPQGTQYDIDISQKVVDYLGIEHVTINIGKTVQELIDSISCSVEPNAQTIYNIPARIRMTTLYAVSSVVGGRVANTSNLSEDWIGWATKFGDAAGDFSPLSNLTVTEVLAIGNALGLPNEFIYKIPEDGLTGKSDEENFGFSYKVLDNYIRTGICEDDNIRNKIDSMFMYNRHKVSPMPVYKQGI